MSTSASSLPQTPTTPKELSFDVSGGDSLPRDLRRASISNSSQSATWAGSQEQLKDEIDSQGHVHGPHCERSVDELVSEWEDTDDEAEHVAEGDDDDDPRGPRWTWEVPSRRMVRAASELSILDEWGKAIPFGDLLPDAPREITKENAGQPPFRRLVVFFVGHWWCGLCHDYALVSVAKLSQAQLIREGVRVVLISSGTWKAIAKYRTMFGIPYPVYVDRGTRLYHSLGMRTSFPNPFVEARIKNRPQYHRHAFARQMAGGMMNGMRLSAFKGSPGNFMQLGGEFVFTSGYKCEWVHRMQGRGDHCEAPDVLQAVGVQGEMPLPLQQVPEPIMRMKSESSNGSSTLITRIKSGISTGTKSQKGIKGNKSSVGLDKELKEGFEDAPPLPQTPPVPPLK